MSVSLSKGGNVSLSKESPGLNKILVGLGWDVRSTDGFAFDLDASCFLLTETGKISSDADFVFYNSSCRTRDRQTTFTDPGVAASEDARGLACHPSLSVVHTGDNIDGDGDGDDESIEVTLSAIPANFQKLAIAVTIHDSENRRQNFGSVSNAFVRVVDQQSGVELARYDLTEDASTETAMTFGEIYKHGAEWKFRAVGQGFAGGLGPLASHYGVSVG